MEKLELQLLEKDQKLNDLRHEAHQLRWQVSQGSSFERKIIKEKEIEFGEEVHGG